MASSFVSDIKHQLRQSNTLQKLLIANIAVFLLVNITKSVMWLFKVPLDDYFNVTYWLAVPASLDNLLHHPWTLITYMFLHEEFLHILFNMLWLYWMGQILMEYLGTKKLFSTYILGGLCGAILYIVSFNVFPLFSNAVDGAFALGASASVLAITVAAATLLPEYPVQLILIGRVPLRMIALFTILLDLLSISGNNAGGHIAHLGGALFGFVYIKQLKKGIDLAAWFNRIMDKISSLSRPSSRHRMKVKYKRTVDDDTFLHNKKARQERTDEILDKISKSGYGSLTKEERDFLFRSSKENEK
ncbi:MAG: rhomboid family intramembrane serine protease [Bacteroidetes bacterium]|nr:rhomboid family intramembrane serine protease [Bacteroidota bacterium]